jgi:PIN domain nuclease of toxin-antitoxin system
VKILLDTHAFIWWDAGGGALSTEARRVIAEPLNQIFVSAVSVWEIAIKRRLGKLTFDGSPTAMIGANGFFEVVVTPADGELAGGLDWEHKDPFDKLLVAQAMRLGAVFLTADAAVKAFGKVGVFSAER